jgi:hypothetical protein
MHERDKNTCRILVGRPERKRPVGTKILNMYLKRNRIGVCELDSSGTKWGPVVVSCECGNKPVGSIKDEEFLD